MNEIIKLENIDFYYDEKVLDNINLEIKKMKKFQFLEVTEVENLRFLEF